MGVIVEFNGLAGSGKSTLAREFVHILEQEQDIYWEIRDIDEAYSNLVKYTHKNFSLRYISLKWLCVSVVYIFSMFFLLIISQSQSIRRRIHYFRRGLSIWLNYRIFEKDGDDNCILFVNEGIIAALASLIHMSAYPKCIAKRIIELLTNYPSLLMVNFEVDYDWSFQNIKKRKGGSRFDRMKDDELSVALRNRADLYVYLQSLIQTVKPDSLYIKSRDDVHKNAIVLKEKVYERIN